MLSECFSGSEHSMLLCLYCSCFHPFKDSMSFILIPYQHGTILILTPFVRRAVYLHAIRWPLFATFEAPHWHGLACKSPRCPLRIVRTNGWVVLIVYKTSNLRIPSSDNQTIRAWYVLSEPAYQASGGIKRTGSPTSQEIRKSLEDYPTVLFFHGNAASRAVKYRVQMYGQVTSRLRESKQAYQASLIKNSGFIGSNVLVIDYRGFADSDGSPNEANLNADALAAWNWLISNGANAENIVIFGQSLGTGVSSKLVSQLAAEGTKKDKPLTQSAK